MSASRIERDSMGEMHVPAHALWGASTERARANFGYGDRPLPRSVWRALGLLKGAVARVHGELGLLDAAKADAIARAADELAAGALDEHCVIGAFQTGSGTSSNMNCNEVLANRAADLLGKPRGGGAVHPNDDVNRGQSSNDVFPSAMQLALALETRDVLLPELRRLADALHGHADATFGTIKSGRTHLMDAMPIRVGQEFRGYAQQVERGAARIATAATALGELPLGGTAVGTGVNADPRVAPRALERLSAALALPLWVTTAPFQGQAALDVVVAFSGALRGFATAFYKLTDDLRWMASGPNVGLDELRLPAIQPGSSIMPAKVNPVVCEGVLMACARVLGCDAVIAFANTQARFELHTMMPLVADQAHDAVALLACAATDLREKALAGATLAPDLASRVALNPMLATALAPLVGYEAAAAIAKTAQASGRSVFDVAREATSLDAATLRSLLDPARLAGERGATRDG